MRQLLLVIILTVLSATSAWAEFQRLEIPILVKTTGEASLRPYKTGLGGKLLPISCTLLPGQRVTLVGADSTFNEDQVVIKVPEALTLFGCPQYALVSESALSDRIDGNMKVSKNDPKAPAVRPQEPAQQDLSQTEAVGPQCRECSTPKRIAPDKLPTPEATSTRSFSGEITRYSNSPKVQKMINEAMKNKLSRATGYCYRYVKNALLDGDLSDYYLGGVSASNAGPHLKRIGFKNLLEDANWKKKIKTPDDAPKGAILVYSGGPNGHVEIKTGNGKNGGYVSDYYSDEARTGNAMAGRGRKLIGIYYKPGV